MHKLLCSRCLHRVNVVLPSISNGRSLHCSHVRPYSRWFALYEDVNPVEIPISELPSSSTYTHTAPIGLNDPRSLRVRRSASATSFVPTSVDHSELGGRDTVDEETISNALGTSTGSPSTSVLDLDSLMSTIEEWNLELPPTDPIPSRDLLPSSTLHGYNPFASPMKKLARSSPEKAKVLRSSSRGRGVRSRLLSTSSGAAAVAATATTSAATAATPVVAAPTAAAISAASTGEAVKELETTQSEMLVEDSPPVRYGEINVEVLMDTVSRSDMADLRSILAEAHWPSARLSPHQVSQVFTLIIDQARDCDECREMMRDFACASSRHSLPSHIILLLASRAAREEGVQRALEALQFHQKAFMLAPVSLPMHASLRTEATRSLWKEVAKREKRNESREVLDTAMQSGFVDEPREFVEETLRESMRRGTSFSSIYRQWRELGDLYGSPHHGMDTVVRAAMRPMEEEEEGGRMDRLKTISSFVSKSPSLRIEAFIVYLIVNLLEQGEERAAKHVFSLVSIHGKYWRKILGEMDREEFQTPASLSLVERIADLITYGTIGEIVTDGKKKKNKKKDVTAEVPAEVVKMAEETEEEMDPLSEQMEKIVWRANGGKIQKRKNGFKKEKRRVKIDQKEVHQLAARIQMTWMHLETTINGPSSEGMKRLVLWSMLHRLAIPDSLSTLIPTEKNPIVKRESGV